MRAVAKFIPYQPFSKTGPSGTGKSALCQLVQKQLSVWSHIVHCRSLKGRKDIPEALARAVLLCQEHSPAVLVCDDVDSLVPPSLDGGSPQDQAYYQRCANVLFYSALYSFFMIGSAKYKAVFYKIIIL